MVEGDLERASERAEAGESKIVDLEEELRVIGKLYLQENVSSTSQVVNRIKTYVKTKFFQNYEKMLNNKLIISLFFLC